MTLLVSGLASASLGGIKARVDGSAVNFPDAQPVMVNNRVMVPLRGVFEKMNASVEYDAVTHTVTTQSGGDNIQLTLGSRTATVNGSDLMIEVAPYTKGGSTMVPLRFISEAMRAEVDWVDATQSVEILTKSKIGAPMDMPGMSTMRMLVGTILPFRLDEVLGSQVSRVGDPFKATLDTQGAADYQGLPSGTMIEGHVDVAKPKEGPNPGVLGLTFDWVRLPDGQSYRIYGTLAGLEKVDIDPATGRMIARSSSKDDDLKMVGYGAAGGILVSLVTEGNVVNDALLGGALGYLLGQLNPSEKKPTDVLTTPQMKFGVKLNRDFMFRVKSGSSSN
jgi:hypothetical protein